MWDFSDARDLLNQSFNVARDMVREIFTGEVGDPVDPLPPPAMMLVMRSPLNASSWMKIPSSMTQMVRSSLSSSMPRVRVESLTASYPRKNP
jgi:hypothetical protein